jgi:hypothetical protein
MQPFVPSISILKQDQFVVPAISVSEGKVCSRLALPSSVTAFFPSPRCSLQLWYSTNNAELQPLRLYRGWALTAPIFLVAWNAGAAVEIPSFSIPLNTFYGLTYTDEWTTGHAETDIFSNTPSTIYYY